MVRAMHAHRSAHPGMECALGVRGGVWLRASPRRGRDNDSEGNRFDLVDIMRTLQLFVVSSPHLELHTCRQLDCAKFEVWLPWGLPGVVLANTCQVVKLPLAGAPCSVMQAGVSSITSSGSFGSVARFAGEVDRQGCGRIHLVA